MVVILGIGEYVHDKQLIGMTKDYTNLIYTFYQQFGYSVLVMDNKNNLHYGNKKPSPPPQPQAQSQICNSQYKQKKLTLKNNFKLKWVVEEIEELIQHTVNILSTQKHDSLMFFISSHGEQEGVIIDSNGTEVELHLIFDNFFGKYCPVMLNKPKLFFIDACRGSLISRPFDKENAKQKEKEKEKEKNAKANKKEREKSKDKESTNHVQNNTQKENEKEEKEEKENTESDVKQNPKAKEKEKEKQEEKQQRSSTSTCTNRSMRGSSNTNDNTSKQVKNEWKLSTSTGHIKTQSGSKSHSYSRSQSSLKNYCHNQENCRFVYRNPDGYAVVDGGEKGGYLIQATKDVFNRRGIEKRKLDDIIKQLREKTKKLIGKGVTETIQDVNQMNFNVYFKKRA